jgi:methylmalonyl-CoA mutase N-terminal domain/subunit
MATQQREKLDRLRAERDSGAAEQALQRLRAAATGEENLMPAIIEAVHAYCTLGEISGAMREVFGEYKALAAI